MPVEGLGPGWATDSSADQHAKRLGDSDGDSYLLATDPMRQKGNGGVKTPDEPVTEEVRSVTLQH